MSNSQLISMPTLKCEKVVVFIDRAEVRRLLEVTLNKGENEIVITNCSSSMDKDTVRIEGYGSASILDVISEDRCCESGKIVEHDEIHKLKKEIESLEKCVNLLELKKERINKQLNTLNEFAISQASNDTSVAAMFSLVDLYGERTEYFHTQILQVNRDLERNIELLNSAKVNLLKIQRNNVTYVSEIKVLVDSEKENNKVELAVSYVVLNAAWSPKYDIRVFRDGSMTINYNGTVRQATGEDWNDTKLVLSTATPSISGNVPELETQNVTRKPKVIPYKKSLAKKSKKKKGISCCGSTKNVPDYLEDSAPVSYFDEVDTACLNVLTAEVTEGITASTFEIPRKSSVPADNNTHKVSIGIINLKPDFEYEVVPKKSTHAFLKAKVKNTSAYAMLAGPANVFLDNNFIAKTQLKSYSPQEEFSCSLGVDPAIRIDYKPVRKYQEQSGLIQKTKSITFEQQIEVKNTTSNTIKILLTDQLPLSNDDKIQVKLLEPQLKAPQNQNVKLNKSNNLEFDLSIESGAKKDVVIKYTVEHSPNEDIEFF